MTATATDTTTTTSTTTTVVFFDAWGNWWLACNPETPGAQAFGPTGAAIELSSAGIPRGLTAWELARRAGTLVRSEDEFGFDTLKAS